VGLDWLQSRPMDLVPVQFSARGVDQDFTKTLAAVGQRRLVRLRVREGLANGRRRRCAGRRGAERMFELVEGQENAHAAE
jgi:hypothetical protein